MKTCAPIFSTPATSTTCGSAGKWRRTCTLLSVFTLTPPSRYEHDCTRLYTTVHGRTAVQGRPSCIEEKDGIYTLTHPVLCLCRIECTFNEIYISIECTAYEIYIFRCVYLYIALYSFTQRFLNVHPLVIHPTYSASTIVHPTKEYKPWYTNTATHALLPYYTTTILHDYTTTRLHY